MYRHPLAERAHGAAGFTAGTGPVAFGFGGAFGRVPQRAVVAFARCFAVMLGARLPLVQALEAAEGQIRNARLRRVLAGVRRDVQGGRSLSEGFAAHPAVFDPLFVQLTRVGEAAGVLHEVLLRLAGYLEESAALRRRVSVALTYPAFVLAVALAATAFLLAAVVPTFAELYADFGAELPAPTRLLLAASGLLSERWGTFVLVAAGAAAALAAWRRSPAGRAAGDRVSLHLPFVGGLVRRHVVARCCRTLGTLLSCGVPLADALDLVARTTGNTVVAREVGRILERVRGGSSLHQPLRQARLFPEMVVQMIAVGEQTAELDRMLLHAAAFYEQEVEAAVDALTSSLEPVLIVVVGALMGGILMSLYLPLFDLIQVVG